MSKTICSETCHLTSVIKDDKVKKAAHITQCLEIVDFLAKGYTKQSFAKGKLKIYKNLYIKTITYLYNFYFYRSIKVNNDQLRTFIYLVIKNIV